MSAIKTKADRAGIVVYMTPDERRYLHCAAAHFVGANGRRMSAGEFSISAAMARVGEGSDIKYERQQKKDFYRGNLLAFTSRDGRKQLHRVAKKRGMSTSEFILRAAMDEAAVVNASVEAPA